MALLDKYALVLPVQKWKNPSPLPRKKKDQVFENLETLSKMF